MSNDVPNEAVAASEAKALTKSKKLVVVGACVAVVAVAGGVAAWRLVGSGKGALPFDATRLPGQTTGIWSRSIDAARETDPTVRTTFLASYLGSGVCVPEAQNPADVLLRATTRQEAIEFLSVDHQEEVRTVLTCGRDLVPALLQPRTTVIFFQTDDEKLAIGSVLDLKLDQLPTQNGHLRQSFSGLSGFCHIPKKADDGKEASDKDCTDTSSSAVHDGSKWVFGAKSGIAAFAKSMAQPKEHVSSAIEALQEAANATAGMSWVSIDGKPKSARDTLAMPCAWAASGVAESDKSDEFMTACFPASEKQLETITGKLRAVAHESDRDLDTAGAVRGQMILVARDSEAANDLERDVSELIRDWKAHVENNEAKLVKLTKDGKSPDQKVFAAIMGGAYVRALKGMRVSKSGRVVKVRFEQNFADDEVRDVKDAVAKTSEKKKAVAAVLAAIEKRQPVPNGPLTQLLGSRIASFIADPGLGLDAEEFRGRWNVAIERNGGKASMLKFEDLPPDQLDMSIENRVTQAKVFNLDSSIEKVSGAVRSVTLVRHANQDDMGADVMNVVVMRYAIGALVHTLTPDVDEQEIIKELGMKNGTSTSTTKGAVKYAYMSDQGGKTETITASVASGAPAAKAATPKSAGSEEKQ